MQNAKDSVLKVRGQSISFLFLFFPRPFPCFPPQGLLTCVGVPRVQVEVRQRMFPSLCLSVVFLATWKLEAAALIGTHPSPSTTSSVSLSLSLFQNSLFHHRVEKKGVGGGEGGGQVGGEERRWGKEGRVVQRERKIGVRIGRK